MHRAVWCVSGAGVKAIQMPNWCVNHITVKHDDPAMITRLVDAFDRDELLSEFYPPSELSIPENDVDPVNTTFKWADLFDPKCVLDRASYGWGTKWDTGKTCSGGRQPKVNKDGKTVRLRCDTAWAPPVGVFKRWQELGFTVNVKYDEPGMQLRGTWPEQA